jgi:hypothetical protein
MPITLKKLVLGRTNRPLSFDTTWIVWKTTPQTILLCRGKVYIKPLPSNDMGIHRQTHRLSFDTTRTAYKTTCPTILLLLRIIVAAVPIRWIPGTLSPGIKRQGPKADHSSPASAEVKKVWIYTSIPHTPSYRDNFNVIRCSGNVFTEPLPSNDGRDTHVDTD